MLVFDICKLGPIKTASNTFWVSRLSQLLKNLLRNTPDEFSANMIAPHMYNKVYA
jgi:hypothetical protein